MSLSVEVKNLAESVKNLAEEIQYIKEIIHENNNYNKTLREFMRNPAYTIEYEQGLAKPTETYASNKKENICHHDGGPWPHLNHTFNPQLNNITDMIQELLDCACNDKKRKEIIKDLDKAKEKINEIIIPEEEEIKEPRKIEDIINQMKEIIGKLDENRCITIKDLEEYFNIKGKSKIKINEVFHF